MRFQYHYPKNKLHLAVLIMGLIGAIPFVLFSVFFVWGSVQEHNTYFMLAGGGFAIFGICLLYLSIFYFRKTRAFFRSGDWYGIVVNGDQLRSAEFDIISQKPKEILISEIIAAREVMYRGLRRLQVKTKKRFYSLPVFRLQPDDRKKLYQLVKAEELPAAKK